MSKQLIVQDGTTGQWLRFHEPVETIRLHTTAGIRGQLDYIEQRVEQDGLYAAGFLAYEAAGAFDPALVTHRPTPLPLLYFALFKTVETLTLEQLQRNRRDYQVGEWRSTIKEQTFYDRIAAVKAHIATGDTYQVNFTHRLRTAFSGDPFSLFVDLNTAQLGRYGAFIELGDFTICSASPELFFTRDGYRLLSKPMKGTAARGLTLLEDQANIDWLRRSEKNQAENVMIVDMIRNDMGRIAELGSVNVTGLFDITPYPTVLQMTSTVEAKSTASLGTIMASLFPCASITGAPKVRTMELIRSLEQAPRGMYCGSIGFVMPGGRTQFNVAIRTVTIDHATASAEYGTGGGIVWDSEAVNEYHESLLKARVLTTRRPTFQLIESLLWETELWETKPWNTAGDYWLLDYHLDRIEASATYFQIPFDRDEAREALLMLADTLTEDSKVRMLVAPNGTLRVESSPKGILPAYPQIGLAAESVNSNNLFLYHKTTLRDVYNHAKQSRPDCGDVLLWNERGEITEASSSNVVFELDGQLVTPPISSGILGGTHRRLLLENGEIRERVVHIDDLPRITRIWLINSVRGWREGYLKIDVAAATPAP